MAVTGLDHVNISTTDVDATRDFFVNVLEFEVGWRPDFPFRGAWLYRGGKDLVHLAEVANAGGPSRGSGLDHFAFTIDDFEEAVRRLDAHGVVYRQTSAPGHPHIRQLFLTELNGVTIELNCRV